MLRSWMRGQWRHLVRHAFPNPEKDKERFNTWLYAIGSDILGLKNDYIYKYRRVCHSHFEKKYLCRNYRISNNAVPTLNLPKTPSTKYTIEYIEENLLDSEDIYNLSDIPHLQDDTKVTTEVPSTEYTIEYIDETLLDSEDIDNISDIPPLQDDTKVTTEASTAYKVEYIDENLLDSEDIYNLSDIPHLQDDTKVTTAETAGDMKNEMKYINLTCRVCLRPGIGRAGDMDERLVDLHEELCDYDDIFDSSALNFCSVCEYQLKKCYNFRQKCRRAHAILTTCRKRQTSFADAFQRMPASSIWFASMDNQRVYNITHDDNDDPAKSELTVLKPKPVDEKILENQIKKDTTLTKAKETKIDFQIDSSDSVGEDDDFYGVEILECYIDHEKLTNVKDTVTSTKDTVTSTKGTVTSRKDTVTSRKGTETLTKGTLTSTKKTSLKSDKDLLMKNKRLNRMISEFKNKILKVLEEGPVDCGKVVVTKEIFLDMFERYDTSKLPVWGNLRDGPRTMARIKKFLLHLHTNYNPVYETVFDVQYLSTREMKLAEFESRKQSEQYLLAPFKCELCYRGFETPTMLNYHCKWHDESRPVACDICPMRYLNRKIISDHMRIAHSAVFRCKLCPVVTSDIKVVVNHFEQHQGVTHSCDLCPGQYKSRSALLTHRQKHGLFVCVHCEKHFPSDVRLKNHVREKHAGAFLCDICDGMFNTKVALTRHVRLKHEPQNKRTKPSGPRRSNRICYTEGCGVRFNSWEERREHERDTGHFETRTGWAKPRLRDGPYRTCPVCQKQVRNAAAISLYAHHMREHPQQPYVGSSGKPPSRLCDQCGITFSSYSKYSTHMNRHMGVRPFACARCPARFHALQHLKFHLERHQPWRHKCSECGKLFGTNANLTIHMRTHIGDRRYKCELCSKGFLSSTALKEHVKGVHLHIRRVKKNSGAPTIRRTILREI